MAKGDVLIRMKADVSNYDANIAKARKSLADFKEANLSTGGMIRTATSSLLKFAGGFSAVSAAVKVAGDVFRSNEETMDAWGRTVESAKSVYDGFLYALNTGDISGFLGNINSIVQAARDAYDALDELGTFNAFNQRRMAQVRRDFSQSVADYRMGEGSKENVTQAAEAYKKELRDLAAKQEEAYNKAIENLAVKRGVSTEGLRSVLTGTYDKYKAAKGVSMSGSRPQMQFLGPGNYTIGTEGYAVNDVEKLGEMLKNLNDTELQSVQALGAAADTTGEQIASIDRQLARVTNGRAGKESGKPSALTSFTPFRVSEMQGIGAGYYRSRADIEDEIQRQQKVLRNATNAYDEWAAQSRISGLQWQLSDEGRQAAKIGLDRDSLQALAEAMAAALGNVEGIKIDKVEKKTVTSFEEFAGQFQDRMGKISAISSGVGNIVGGLQQLGIEIPEGIQKAIGVMQAVMSIISGISSILSIIAAIQTVKATPVIGALLHTGGVVHAAGGYRVPGNYGYDAVPAMLTSGETVLTRAQAGNLASQLAERNAGQSMQPFVDGETIFLGMNNTSKRMGRGEIVTTSTLRRLGLI